MNHAVHHKMFPLIESAHSRLFSADSTTDIWIYTGLFPMAVISEPQPCNYTHFQTYYRSSFSWGTGGYSTDWFLSMWPTPLELKALQMKFALMHKSRLTPWWRLFNMKNTNSRATRVLHIGSKCLSQISQLFCHTPLPALMSFPLTMTGS